MDHRVNFRSTTGKREIIAIAGVPQLDLHGIHRQIGCFPHRTSGIW
jgi:hypothetical protein